MTQQPLSPPASVDTEPETLTEVPSVTWIVTRHAGALEWLRKQGWAGTSVAHLELQRVKPGDRVVGTLPLHLAAAVCEQGGRYFHLSLDVTPELRGRELSAGQMRDCGARLEAFEVRRHPAAADLCGMHPARDRQAPQSHAEQHAGPGLASAEKHPAEKAAQK